MNDKDRWISIADYQARSHELYGIKNWLAFFLVTQVFSLIRLYGDLSSIASTADIGIFEMLRLDHPIAQHLGLIAFSQIFAAAVIFWYAAYRHPAFRRNASAALFFPVLISAVGLYRDPYEDGGLTAIATFVAFTVYAVIWLAYLQRSRRVRVTFENQVRDDDPLVRAHPVEIKQTPFAEDTSASHDIPVTPERKDGRISATDYGEEELWAAALAEFESENRRLGLWARVFSEAKGNEDAAKAAYLRARVTQLADTKES